ncbi:MAG: PepSY domain-containing protein [Gammaproteobacteria bacterium]|nr:PepSY domain-containing protein [Gammaproteobacteria bacterium]
MLKSKSKSLPGQARTRYRRPSSIVVLLLLLYAPALWAQDHFLAQQNADSPAVEQVAQVSQRQALELVRARFSGNVISINEVQQQGERFYRVRMDNDGNIFTVYVNATTGAIRREQ